MSVSKMAVMRGANTRAWSQHLNGGSVLRVNRAMWTTATNRAMSSAPAAKNHVVREDPPFVGFAPQKTPPGSASKGDEGEMEYEDYSTTSKTYDTTRAPIGLDSLTEALKLASGGRPVDELKLLDVGCGTGNYLDVVKHQVGSCHGLEFNEGMLAQSVAKHAGDDRVSLMGGSVLDMSCFEDGSFDTVIMTQVLHHLTPLSHSQALSEISRVLKPGGTFWISTQTPIQHMEGFWWAPLIPQAAATLAARFPGNPMFSRMLANAGLQPHSIDVPDAPLMKVEAYLDLEGPFRQLYRDGDSTWSLASSEELEAGLDWWQAMHDSGDAESWLAQREQIRSEVGQTSAVTSVKATDA